MRSFQVGDRVSQATYGDGTITAINERHTVVNFDAHGTRTFATPIVRLEPSSTTAPAAPARASRRKRTTPTT
jgi:hypothetical protein